MSTVELAIDPGISGGLVFVGGDKIVAACPMPVITAVKNKRKKSVVDSGAIDVLLRQYTPERVFIEDVHSSPQMGVTSAFSFGQGLGRVEGLSAAHIREILYVPPQTWKARLGCTADKDQTMSRGLLPAKGGLLLKAYGSSVSLLIKPHRRGKVKPPYAVNYFHEGMTEAALIGLYGRLCLDEVRDRQKKR